MTMKHARQNTVEVSINHKSATQPRKTQTATSTLEHKLERVSYKPIITQHLEMRKLPNIISVDMSPGYSEECFHGYIFTIWDFVKVFVPCPLQASTLFCEELTKNNHLRQDIQALHGERVHFLQLHHRLRKVRGHTIVESETMSKNCIWFERHNLTFRPLFDHF